MIQQLRIPPLVPSFFIDSYAGTVEYDEPASSVTLSSGTLTSVGLLVPQGGTLTTGLSYVYEYDAFDWSTYRDRDFELVGRDHVVAAATVRVSSYLSTIFGCRIDRPIQLAVTDTLLPDTSEDRSTPISSDGSVDHVVSSSVPFDSTATDKDLYARDLLLHEALVRASSVMVHPPVASSDVSGTAVVSIDDTWSLADATSIQSGISPALRLDVDLFRNPDRAIAYSDNGLGVYVANVEGFLKNPFITAERLVIQVTSTGGTSHESEVYVHDVELDTETTRTWVAEPRLDGRLKIVYTLTTGLLRWYPQNSNQIHIPVQQPFAEDGVTIPGPDSNITFVVDTLAKQDSAFFAQKASNVVTANGYANISLFSGAYGASIDQGNLVQAVQITQSNSVRLQSMPTSTTTYSLYVGLTVIPRSFFEVLGCQLDGLTSTADGGGLFPAATSTQASYALSVLPGNYQLEIRYTNYGGDTPSDFPVLVTFEGAVITSSPLPFSDDGYDDGDVVTRTYNVLSSGLESNVSVLWEGPAATTSQLKILSIRVVSSDTTPISIKLTSTFMETNTVLGTSTCEFNGLRNRPDVTILKFDLSGTITTPSVIVSLDDNTNLTAFAIDQVQCAVVDTTALTPNAAGFEGFPMAVLNRAFESVVDSFKAITSYTDPRQLYSGDIYQWSTTATTSWINQLLTTETRLLSAFRLGGPLDVGRPCLIPNGLEYIFTANHSSGLPPGSVWAKSEDTSPRLVSAKPWMLTQRFLVANDSFMGFGMIN
jgi:hypothetical protein